MAKPDQTVPQGVKVWAIQITNDDGDWIKSAETRKRETKIHDDLAKKHAAEQPAEDQQG